MSYDVVWRWLFWKWKRIFRHIRFNDTSAKFSVFKIWIAETFCTLSGLPICYQTKVMWENLSKPFFSDRKFKNANLIWRGFRKNAARKEPQPMCNPSTKSNSNSLYQKIQKNNSETASQLEQQTRSQTNSRFTKLRSFPRFIDNNLFFWILLEDFSVFWYDFASVFY